MDTRIVQLIFTPNNCEWQGRLLGLGSDGTTYYCNDKGRWEPFILPLSWDEGEAGEENDE